MKKFKILIIQLSLKNQSHLMISTFLVVKTVAAREISIIKWNCLLMVYMLYIVRPVLPRAVGIIKWKPLYVAFVCMMCFVFSKLCIWDNLTMWSISTTL